MTERRHDSHPTRAGGGRAVRYTVMISVACMAAACLIGLANVLFGDVAKTKVAPEYYIFVLWFGVSTVLLGWSALLYWKRKKIAPIAFGTWCILLAAYLFYSTGVDWLVILAVLPGPLAILVLMIITGRPQVAMTFHDREERDEHDRMPT